MSNMINKFFAASLTAVVLASAATAILTAPANAQDAGKAIKMIRQSSAEGVRLSAPTLVKAYGAGATTVHSTFASSHPMAIGRRR